MQSLSVIFKMTLVRSKKLEIEGTVSAIFFHENNALRYPFPFPYLKDLQAIDPLFVTITKPLSNKSGETFCDGLK